MQISSHVFSWFWDEKLQRNIGIQYTDAVILQSEKFLKSVLQRQVVSIFQPNLKHLRAKITVSIQVYSGCVTHGFCGVL